MNMRAVYKIQSAQWGALLRSQIEARDAMLARFKTEPDIEISAEESQRIQNGGALSEEFADITRRRYSGKLKSPPTRGA